MATHPFSPNIRNWSPDYKVPDMKQWHTDGLHTPVKYEVLLCSEQVCGHRAAPFISVILNSPSSKTL